MKYFRWNIFQLGNNVIGVLSILIQTFCSISITFVQLTYRVGDQKIDQANATKRMNQMYDEHIEELNVGNWFTYEVEKSKKVTCLSRISNVTALTAWPWPIVKLRSRSRSRSGEGQEGQIWT